MGLPESSNISFPDYRRPRPQALLLLAALFGIGAMASFPFSVWGGLACFLLALGCYLPWATTDRHNRQAREAWILSSPRHATFEELEVMANQQPGKWRLHVKAYAGFDPKYVSPAAALSTRESDEITIIDPLPADFRTRCKALGIDCILN
jgi:hypothetical protein